jgi:hypothetical protein
VIAIGYTARALVGEEVAIRAALGEAHTGSRRRRLSFFRRLPEFRQILEPERVRSPRPGGPRRLAPRLQSSPRDMGSGQSAGDAKLVFPFGQRLATFYARSLATARMRAIGRHARRVVTAGALVVTLTVVLRNRRVLVSSAFATWSAGWMVVPALALFLIWNQVATLAWRGLAVATSSAKSTPPVWRLALLRFQGQALNLLFPAAGEVARAAGIADRRGRISIVLDLVSCAVAEAAFAVSAVGLHPGLRPSRAPVVVAFGGLLVAIAAAWWWLPELAARAASRFGGRVWLGAEVPPAFRRAVGWHLVECVLSAGEIWIFSTAMGLSLPFTSIYFAAAAVRTGTTIVGFIPGQVGVAEGSLVWAMTSLGYPASLGLSLAFARRARQVVVMATGALSMLGTSLTRSAEPKVTLDHENSLHPAG